MPAGHCICHICVFVWSKLSHFLFLDLLVWLKTVTHINRNNWWCISQIQYRTNLSEFEKTRRYWLIVLTIMAGSISSLIEPYVIHVSSNAYVRWATLNFNAPTRRRTHNLLRSEVLTIHCIMWQRWEKNGSNFLVENVLKHSMVYLAVSYQLRRYPNVAKEVVSYRRK